MAMMAAAPAESVKWMNRRVLVVLFILIMIYLNQFRSVKMIFKKRSSTGSTPPGVTILTTSTPAVAKSWALFVHTSVVVHTPVGTPRGRCSGTPHTLSTMLPWW